MKVNTKLILKPKTIYSLHNNEEYVKRYLNEFLRYEIYSPAVVKVLAEAPEHLKKVPLDIQALTKARLSSKETTQLLSERTLLKAIKVLETYDTCHGLEDVHYLSRAGHRTLKRFKKAVQEKNLTPEIIDEAAHTANKFLINLDLFLPLNYLKQSNLFMTQKPVVFELRRNELEEMKNAQLMPFPVMMKAYELLTTQKEKGVLLAPKGESVYFDPVMNASIDDVVLFARTRLLQRKPMILTSQDDAFLKNALLITPAGTVQYHAHYVGYILNDKVKKVTSHLLHRNPTVRGAWELE